jgi:hypothetical protein
VFDKVLIDRHMDLQAACSAAGLSCCLAVDGSIDIDTKSHVHYLR